MSLQKKAKKHQMKLEGNQVQNQKKEVGLHTRGSAAELLFAGYCEHQQLRLVQGAPDKFIELESTKSY